MKIYSAVFLLGLLGFFTFTSCDGVMPGSDDDKEDSDDDDDVWDRCGSYSSSAQGASAGAASRPGPWLRAIELDFFSSLSNDYVKLLLY